MKVEIVVESGYAGLLIDLLLREVGMLRDMADDADYEVERRDTLLAEKAEIIKKLSETQPRNKVTATKRGPGRPKKVGRPKGSKTKKKGVKQEVSK